MFPVLATLRSNTEPTEQVRRATEFLDENRDRLDRPLRSSKSAKSPGASPRKIVLRTSNSISTRGPASVPLYRARPSRCPFAATIGRTDPLQNEMSRVDSDLS